MMLVRIIGSTLAGCMFAFTLAIVIDAWVNIMLFIVFDIILIIVNLLLILIGVIQGLLFLVIIIAVAVAQSIVITTRCIRIEGQRRHIVYRAGVRSGSQEGVKGHAPDYKHQANASESGKGRMCILMGTVAVVAVVGRKTSSGTPTSAKGIGDSSSMIYCHCLP